MRLYRELLVVSFLALTWKLEYYKFELMSGCAEEERRYPVFPHSEQPQLSASSPIWLIVHLASALFHLSLAYLRLMGKNPILEMLFPVSHYIFCTLIAINVHHFGEFSLPIALTANGTPLLFAHIAYLSSTKRSGGWYSIYLLSISSPVLFELAIRASSYL